MDPPYRYDTSLILQPGAPFDHNLSDNSGRRRTCWYRGMQCSSRVPSQGDLPASTHGGPRVMGKCDHTRLKSSHYESKLNKIERHRSDSGPRRERIDRFFAEIFILVQERRGSVWRTLSQT